MNKDTFLLDREFLRLLDLEREKEIFAKVILLDFQENVLEEIEGRVTQGSITIDGTSTVRRTCSITLAASELNIHEYYWGLNSKFRLYIGSKNVLKERGLYKDKYKNYPDICWFKMGTYIISTFNTTQSTNQYTISLQGRDKMTLLNGEVGGIITPLSWDFGKIDEVNADGTVSHKEYLIKDIILEAVHEHAKEPYWNIIVNDLEDCGLELLEYRGDVPLYFLYSLDTTVVEQTYFDIPEELLDGRDIEDIVFDPRIEIIPNEDITRFVHPDDKDKPEGEQRQYTMMKAEYGDVIGYRTTDLVYAGDLISNVGETVTSMLDKIIAMLGTFEYFYDLDGRFIFQRKKAYVKNLFAPAGQIGANDGSQSVAETSALTYSFDNSMLVTSFANTPEINNLKNDFSLWGVRKGVSGIEIPIHLRYAIDTKPWFYAAYNGMIYVTEEGFQKYKDIFENNQEWIRQYQQAVAERSGRYIFRKTEVPSFLKNENGTSDWWDINNWAEYYKILTGDYPKDELRTYGTEGYNGIITWPNGTTQSLSSQLIIDLDTEDYNLFYGNGPQMTNDGKKMGYNMVNDRPTLPYQEYTNSGIWTPLIHGFTGCIHTYSEFLYLNSHNHCKSFIYKPQIPNIQMSSEEIEAMTNVYIDIGQPMELNLDIIKICDWRELIYQMSLDKNKHQHDETFYVTIDKNNTLPDGTHLYLGGHTGYEQYYVDINGFWRDLYDPDYQYTYEITWVRKKYFDDNKSDLYVYQNCGDMNYLETMAAINAWAPYCGTRLYRMNYRNQFIPVTTIEPDYFNEHSSEYYFIRHCDELKTEDGQKLFDALDFNQNEKYYVQFDDEYDKTTYWSSTVTNNPEGLNFWFDFLDSEGDIGNYKVCKIGDRAKAANDTNIKSIYFRDVPTVIFVNPNTTIAEEKSKKGTGYTYIQLPEYLENLFFMSSQGKSAMDILDDWIYSFAYCTESITLNTLPIYYLEPNTRIFVRDDNSGINGEYILTRLTIPLTHNGTMSIAATKAVENLY